MPGVHQKIHNQPDHQLLLPWITLGNQQGQGHQSVVVDAGLIEQVVFLEEQQEKESADPLVAVAEGMILDDKVKKVGSLFFHAGVEFPVAEGLVEVADDPLQMMLPLLAEQSGA